LKGRAGIAQLLRQLRCIQLDPLNPLGTNADLVVLARVRGVRRGDVYDALLPAHAFEHFAKERCLLPAEAFAWYRLRAAEAPWWRLSERLRRLPKGLIEEVREEIRARGPITVADLSHRGRVRALDWNGWKGTSNAARMAVEVLWTRCEVVVCRREGNTKWYDVAARALPHFAGESPGHFEPWAIVERVKAAGLLARAGGPAWSMLNEVRQTELVEHLVESGELEEVTIRGSNRRYLASRGFREERFPDSDGQVRLLGPLDPLIWDRGLVKQVFNFDYVWEVYKPLASRKWGWYVCPLLKGETLIGRIDAAIEGEVLQVRNLWRESREWKNNEVDEALQAHAEACGATRVVRGKARPPESSGRG
jgi:uncharacterized protein YcaQ